MSFRSRRSFLWDFGGGIAGIALLDLLKQDRILASNIAVESPLLPKKPHFAPKAKAVISLFMNGGVSQLDTFDPKRELDKRHLEAPPASLNIQTFFPNPGTFLKSPFSFKKYGEAGLEVSELFPHIAQCSDDIALVRSMHALSNNHSPAILQMMTGFIRPGRPSMGSWILYGLGSENQRLPAFIVLLDNVVEGPLGGAQNWNAGFLPGAYQGTPFRNQGDPIVDLASPKYVEPEQQRSRLDFIKMLNENHAAQRAAETDLPARIAAYELAFRMQSEAPEVIDLSKESETTRKLYGMDDAASAHFGRNCLLARRLVEKGVRFVQLFAGGNAIESWDAHRDLEKNHRQRAAAIDKPIHGLLTDLKSRGLLDSTLVVWHTEFGRMPISQSVSGRDHNPGGFSVWLAGGGVKGGQVIGGTDEFGYHAVMEPHSINDLHATILHKLGLDHTQLTYFHNGRMHRLTDVSGEVIPQLA
jgi:hypothetical protein